MKLLIRVGLTILLIVGIVCFSIILLFSNNTEHYNTWTGEIVCKNVCWHEFGHKLDHMSGWVSSTPEFKKAIAGMEIQEFSFFKHPLNWLYIRSNNNEYKELYAIILDDVQGDLEKLPEQLKPFYNQDILYVITGEFINDK